MLDILSKPCRPVLERFVWSRLAIAMDFDGTMAPIVSSASSARVRKSTAALARRLSELFPCAIISSRAQADLKPRLQGLGAWTTWAGATRVSAAARARVLECLGAVTGALREFRGVEIEDKHSRLTVHFRRSRTKREVLAAVRVVAQAFPDVRSLGGKQVVHLQPRDVPDKSSALDEILARHGCDTALYVGDDETDEDVFSKSDPRTLLSVRVGRSATSRARYFVPHQRHVDDLLALLISIRESVGQRLESVQGAPSPLSTGRKMRGDSAQLTALLASLRELDHQREVHSKLLDDSLGLSGQRLAVLRLVGRYPLIAPGQLAQMMRVDPSALTPMLKTLVAQGFLTRTVDPTNKRRHQLGLTASGRALDEPTWGTIEAAAARTVARSRTEDLQATQRVLETLARSFLE